MASKSTEEPVSVQCSKIELRAVIMQLSRLVGVELDKETMLICVDLLEAGVDPADLAACVKELKKLSPKSPANLLRKPRISYLANINMEMPATQHDSTGFNYEFGKTWIYPSNLPIRKYQKDIVSKALFKNTMVCLPTGLGKTFIAAVVMHNYFRWYPSGKVIFMATTKPLVKQQVDACYRIVAMPKEYTAELTGSVLKTNRQPIWHSKRVFFLTPQVLLNDLDTVPELGTKIRCIVIDEAHRGRGNHAYCEVIRKLITMNKEFRVLALTATPASSVVEVINICHTLLISHLEIRTEESVDVVPYLHKKSIETYVLKLDGKLHEVLEKYKMVLDKYVRILIKHNAIHSNFNSLHKGRLFYLSKEYQEKNAHNKGSEEYKLIVKVFGTCTILYHAYDLLLRHGMRSFVKFYEENIGKPLLIGCSTEIQEILTIISQHVGPPLVYEKLPDCTRLQLPENCKFGHPKFYKLAEIINQHFDANNPNDSKVIIFCEYKESVVEAYAVLLGQKNVKPKMFMGQSTITQKQQVNIIESFRSGNFNTLISTCIGEEGIDVGFVDMVICFDISNKSSIRFIQRIGRTGRDRNGKVVILVSEGREQQVLKECLQEKQNLCDSFISAQAAHNFDDRLYKHSPKMIPEGVVPQCQELFIAPKDKSAGSKDFFVKLIEKPNLDCSKVTRDNYNMSDLIPSSKFISLGNHSEDLDEGGFLKFNKQAVIRRQRVLQSVFSGFSKDSEILTSLMKLVECKRFNIPVSTQTIQRESNPLKKKQVDIRHMFKRSSLTQELNGSGMKLKEDSVTDKFNAQITSLFGNVKDCGLCCRFENDFNIKRDLVPIDHLQYDIDLSCVNSNNVRDLLQIYKEEESGNREKESLEQAKISEIFSLNVSQENTKLDTSEVFDIDDDILFERILITEGPNSEEVSKSQFSEEKPTIQENQSLGNSNMSDDLFDDNPEDFTTPTSLQNAPSSNSTSLNVHITEMKSSCVHKTCEDFNTTKSNKSEHILKSPEKEISRRPENPSKNPHSEQEITLIAMQIANFLESEEDHQQASITPEKVSNCESSKNERSPSDFDDDIIEASPLFSTKQNSSRSSPTRIKKQKKFNLTDVFDLSFFKKLAPATAPPRRPSENASTVSSDDSLPKSKKNFLVSDLMDETTLFAFKNPTPQRLIRIPHAKIVAAPLVTTSPDLSQHTQTMQQSLFCAMSEKPERKAKKFEVTDVFDRSFLLRKPRLSTKKSNVSVGQIPKSVSSNSAFDRRASECVGSISEPVPSTDTSPVRISTEKMFESPGSPIIKSKKNLKPRFLDTIIDEEQCIEIDPSPEKSSNSSLSTINASPSPKKGIVCGKQRTKRKRGHAFIDSEAEVESNDEQSSDEVFSQDPDVFEESFVDDEIRLGDQCTQMQAVYLESVKSPIKRGKPLFKRPQLPLNMMDTMVDDLNVDLTYVKDTFIVDDEDDHIEFDTQEELSELERAELILEEKKKRKKRKEMGKGKRKVSSGSSDLEESLKKKRCKWNRITLDSSESD